MAYRRPMRDPARALRAVGVALLGLEALVVLLAVAAAVQFLPADRRGTAVAVLVGLAAAAVLVAGALPRRWSLVAGTLLQLGVILAGLLTWPLYVLGAVFGLLWAYYLRLRVELARGPRPRAR
jgi:hypothetical protein